MKQKWFAGALGAIALVSATAWTQFGVAHAVFFVPPINSSAPRQATGGASRGGFFVPPVSSSAPRQATGGASRGSLFTPSPGRRAPQQATGGASRGGLFAPPPGRSAPQQAMGGASRGSFFTPDPDRGAPQQAAGGASRANTYGTIASATGLQSMLALMPESFYGTTLEARPTILVYVPASYAQEGVFSLKDEAKNLVYQMTVPVSSEGGVMAVTLPESAPALEVGQNYQWFFALKLDGALTPASPFVDGWVQRVAPSREQSLAFAQTDPITRIAALGAQGIWYDTAAELAALQADQSDDLIAGHWQELLESVGLADVAAAPMVN